jgi:glucokinase
MTVVGIDLGDDRVTAVSVDENGQVSARASEASRAQDLAGVVRQVYRAARPSTTPELPLGITIPFQNGSIPGDVTSALALEGSADSVAVNAGHALALAEAWCGAARGVNDVVSFSIGEHVTAGILVNGAILKGAAGHAGSVAWLALNPVEREDYRRHGGLEAEVAAAGIVRRLVWRIKSGDRSSVVDRVHGELGRLTAEDVVAAARDGDGVCISVVRDTAKYVGMAIANLATIVDPECVVLHGTAAEAGDLMLDAIRTECARRVRPAQSERLRIVPSTLGREAAAIGAARAALLHRR